MAKLTEVYRLDDDKEIVFKKRQLPLDVDNIVMVMDLNGMGLVCESPMIRGRDLDDFLLKYNVLSFPEIKRAFEVPSKDLLAILSQTVPCVGCRRSVERLFYQLVKSNHDALDPLVVTPEGVLSLKESQLAKPNELGTLLHGHSLRLSNLVESQPRSKKSRRCNLHSLDSARTRPLVSNAWLDVWNCMGADCKDELLLIENSAVLLTLETYLRKHRFCGECRTKVMRAYTLLVEEPDPAAAEKGYVAALYQGIRRCLPEKHVHLQRKTDYVAKLIARAEPELMGSRRERHAKTIEIAQEEVLTCLGLCVHERLHRINLRLREEECTCQVLAAVAVEAMCRSFETAVEDKQGVTRLELLYEQITREELVKQQKKEHKKMKRRKKKEKRAGAEAGCECECEPDVEGGKPCACSESVSPTSKVSTDCECEECQPVAKCPGVVKGNFVVAEPSVGKSTKKQNNRKTTCSAETTPATGLTKLLSPCGSCKTVGGGGGIAAASKSRHLSAGGWSSSEHSQDCGYSSENNNHHHHHHRCCDSASGSSGLPSSPEGSDVACSEGLCNHEQLESRCIERAVQRGSLEPLNMNNTRAAGSGFTLTLQQMLDNSCSSDEDDGESFLSAAEVQEFKSNMTHVTERRQELRLKLKERFNKLCCQSHICFPHCASN